MRWTLNLCVLPGLVATLTLCPPALAEQAIDLDAVDAPSGKTTGTTVMVPAFTGARAQTIHARVEKALGRAGLHIVPQSVAGNTKLDSDPANYIFVAQGNGISAFINGKIKLTSNRWTLTLEVRGGANGTVVGSDTISSGWLQGLLKAIDKEAAPKVQALLAKNTDVGAAQVDLEPRDENAKGVDPATADPSLTAASDRDDDEPPKANQVPTPLVLSLGGSLISRSLSYNDAYLDTLRQPLYPHSILLLGLNLGGTWYPGAHFTDGVLANIGLNVHFVRSFGGNTNVGADKVPTQAGAPPKYATVFQELDLGLRGRIPMGSWEMGLNVGWGKQRMGLDGDNVVVRLPYSDADEEYPGAIPDIDIEYYRFGADVGFELFDWEWVVGAGFRTPFYSSKPGQIANERWFPNVIGTTATANLGVNIPLFHQLGLAINADYRQTGMDMNTKPTAIVSVNDDPEQNNLRNAVAGGATDRHILLTAALTWSFGKPDGASKAQTREAEPEQDEEEDTEDRASDDSEKADTDDTSDPSFFEASGKASASPKSQTAKDTSNPDFFK